MTEGRLRLLGAVVLGGSAALHLAGVGLRLAVRPSMSDPIPLHVPDIIAFTVFVAVGAFVVRRRPRNRIGWLLCCIGTAFAVDRFTESYGIYALTTRGLRATDGAALLWLSNWMWVVLISAIAATLLLFPTGALPSRRWRAVALVGTVSSVTLLVGSWTAPGPLLDVVEGLVNPLSVGGAVGAVVQRAADYGLMGLLATLAAGLISLVTRFRAAGVVERQQLKWFSVGAALFVLQFVAHVAFGQVVLPGVQVVLDVVSVAALASLPICIGLAVLRHRLYDVDVVIDRAIVVAALAGMVTVVYLTLMIGVGFAVGRTSSSNVALAVIATAVSAVVFQPLRHRLERFAHRVVYGRATEPEREAGLAIRTLGAFRIVRDGEVLPPTVWQSKKARTLLKVLVARRGRPAPREFLMDVLWPGEDPTTLGNRFSVALTTVRSVLDPERRRPPDHHLVADRDAVRLSLDTVALDVEEFLRTAEEGTRLLRGGDVARGVEMLRRAVELYTGDFLEEDPYAEWAAPLRQEARATYVTAIRQLASHHAAWDQHDEAARYHLRALTVDPWDEAAHLGLVVACAGAGRHGEARRHYRAYCARMDEIGAPVAPYPVRTAHVSAAS